MTPDVGCVAAIQPPEWQLRDEEVAWSDWHFDTSQDAA